MTDADSPTAFDLPRNELIEVFENGEAEIEGRMPYSSNLTLLTHFTDGQRTARGIYKPGQGERPLWDFPPELYRREVAMSRLCEQIGWDVIPPTALVQGPLGEGSVQAFVDAEFQHHYFSMVEDDIGEPDLRQLCLLDWIGNNTDRKGGHCLLGKDGRVYGIDNGLAFHAQFKLRTVLWDYVGDPIDEPDLIAIERFVENGPSNGLAALLDTFEVDAMLTRARALIDDGCYPSDDTGGQRYPWPLV